jgi:hypothetical protein
MENNSSLRNTGEIRGNRGLSALTEEREEKQETGSPVCRRAPFQYTAEEMGDALSLVDWYGGNVLRAAQEKGIPEATLRYWAKNAEKLPARVANVRDRNNADRAAVSYELADWIANSVRQVDIDKAGLRDKAIAYGVFTDKGQLLSGQATQRVESVEVKKAYLVLIERHSREPGEAIEILSEELQLPLDEVKRLCE